MYLTLKQLITFQNLYTQGLNLWNKIGVKLHDTIHFFFFFCPPGHLELHSQTNLVLFNCRDISHFDSIDSFFSALKHFMLLISHSEQSVPVSSLSNSKMCKPLVQRILYFSRIRNVDSVFF